MVLEYKSGVCDSCREVRKVFRDKPNHLIHLLLTVMTGIWIFVWLFLTLRSGSWRCDHCGGTGHRCHQAPL